MDKELKEIQDAYANMSEEEQKEFDEGMRAHYKKMKEIANTINEFIDKQDTENSEEFSLNLYKYALAFARVAVTNDVDMETYMSTCMDMYLRMGGNIDEDIVTPSHSVH